ncbi:MAG: hypothetical protein RIQ79_2676 [Verrucomicrobiota bacterium]|jgi:DNA-binding NarL/FixJ family response regulator
MPANLSSKSVSIYLAEDHEAIRGLLRRHLEMLNTYRIVGETGDGEVAVRDCLRLKPDLLVLDLGLPGTSGLEALRQLRQAGSKTHILVFSSHHEPAIVREALEAGATGMVEKNAPFETLLQAIATVSAGRPFFGAAITQAVQLSLQKHAQPQGVSSLTAREREVLQLVAGGRPNKEVASLLGISVKTAENHRHNLMSKLSARNAADLTRVAFEMGLIVPAAPGPV